MLLRDGYFVHFFAPTEIEPLPKYVVFVLDTSGSMYGTKIEQVKTAMNSILDDLSTKDFIHIISFNSYATVANLTQESFSPVTDYFDYNADYEVISVSTQLVVRF